MTALTRSQFLVGAAAVAVPGRDAHARPAGRARRGHARPGPAAGQRRVHARSRPSSTAATPACARPPSRSRSMPRDLAAALRVARARELAVRMRAGGHSYIGASTVAGGVVLDLRRLRGIQLLADGSVLAGAGLRQIELITALAQRGRAVVHGSCPTVGVAGFTLGGGYGFDARRYGLACDTLVAAHVVDLRTLKPAAGRRRPAAGPARRRREPGARDLPAAAHAPRRRRDDVLRALPVVARRRDRARVQRALRRPRPRRSRRSARSRPARARRRSRCSGSTSAPGAAAARRSTRCCRPARRLSQNTHPYLAGAADLRRLPRQDARAVPAPERGRDARARHVRRRLGLHRPRR